MARISRQQYSDLYGPTTGDKIRLGDTDLYIEIEKDLRVYGEEAVYGGGKTIRDGMGFDNELTSAAGAPDLVITNGDAAGELLRRHEKKNAERFAQVLSGGPQTSQENPL